MAFIVTNQSRNILSKKIHDIGQYQSFLNNIHNFVYVIGSYCHFIGRDQANQGLKFRELCIRSLLAGFCLHSVVRDIANGVTSDTFSRELCEESCGHNCISTALTLTRVFLYSKAKQLKPKPNVAS
ncbi:hypothetical protein CXB51_031960 [Gossypium anomalum]|uniref:Uncharacterized protein n=1 Tax=Gossypium anomalum TaxID=47600 RepID=A0A8J5YDD3_9ROSI|nr:hypothetical protein CXB51_031960 [Gossypium anomalum]